MACVIDEARLPCDSLSTRPGMVALAQVAMDRDRALHSAGIENCRSVRGGAAPSKHGNSEAWDASGDTRAIQRLVDALLARLPDGRLVAELLGVQRIIWQRHIWDCRRSWHFYEGVDPHTSHAHIELTTRAAMTLTRNAIVRAFGIPRHRRPDDMPKLTDIVDQVRLPAANGKTVRVQLEHQGGIRMPDGGPVGGFKGSFFNLPAEARKPSTGRFLTIETYPGKGAYEITDTSGLSFAFTLGLKRQLGIK